MPHALLCRLSGSVSGLLPLAYTAWSHLQVFELFDTNLTGTVPAAYFDSWPSLHNFTIDGAAIGGYLPAPWNCLNLTSYRVQNTPVTADAANPVWVLTPRAANLTQMKAIGLGKCLSSGRISSKHHMVHCTAQQQQVMTLYWSHTATDYVALHLTLHVGGTQLQLPSWTGIKEGLKSNNWPITTISFPKANLTGPVGSLAYYFPKLQMIDLSSNQLSGVVPPDLTSYNGLMHVNLSSNGLYGEYTSMNEFCSRGMAATASGVFAV